MRAFNPSGVAGPFGTYSHGIEVESPMRLVFGSGQTGVDTDGRIGEDIEEQSRLMWRNIEGVLAGAGMRISDIVQLTMLLVDRADLPTARAVREEFLDGHRPASTLMFVAGLAHADWLIEVDFVAARDSERDPDRATASRRAYQEPRYRGRRGAGRARASRPARSRDVPGASPRTAVCRSTGAGPVPSRPARPSSGRS